MKLHMNDGNQMKRLTMNVINVNSDNGKRSPSTLFKRQAITTLVFVLTKFYSEITGKTLKHIDRPPGTNLVSPLGQPWRKKKFV